MPNKQIWTPYGTLGTGSPVDMIERGSDETVTTTTADPTTGTSLAVASRLGSGGGFPQSGNFLIRLVDANGAVEYMLVTAGHGTTAGSWTVTRGQNGTTNQAHASGAVVQMVTSVQRVEPIDSKQTQFLGRAATFRIPGRAGTAGQNLMSIHNATGSPVLVDIQKIVVDLYQTVVKAITVAPPVIRLQKVTVLPTNGSTLPKVPVDSSLTSRSAVTLLQDASADGTGSGTTLTATIPGSNIVTEEYAPRFVTGVGYEPFDRMEFFAQDDEYLTLRALEGLVLRLEYTLATQNPTTDMWVAGVRWREYQLA